MDIMGGFLACLLIPEKSQQLCVCTAGGKGCLEPHKPQPERGEFGPKVRQQPQELRGGVGVVGCRELPAVGQTGDPHIVGEAAASKRMEPLLSLRFRRTCAKERGPSNVVIPKMMVGPQFWFSTLSRMQNKP